MSESARHRWVSWLGVATVLLGCGASTPGGTNDRAPEERTTQQEGPASDALQSVPTERKFATAQQALALGNKFSCALRDGDVYCWGASVAPAMPNGSTTPTRVTKGMVSITARGGHACGVTETGKLKCWGRFEGDEAPRKAFEVMDEVAEAHADANGAVVRLKDGSVRHWRAGAEPADMQLQGAVQVDAGNHHACALLGTGQVRCWGDNHHGVLMRQDISESIAPVPPQTKLPEVKSLALGDAHTCVHGVDNSAWCVGTVKADTRHEEGRREPWKITDHVSRLSAGGDFTCFWMNEGPSRCNEVIRERVFASGGHGRAITRDFDLPTDAIDVAFGDAHRCTLLAGGELRCWGNSKSGECGVDKAYVSTPHPLGWK